MLNLFQSNQMAELASAFCDRNDVGATDNPDPFSPTTVIVQSFGLGQWLKLQLAERSGIAANIDGKLPATFLWQLYQCLMPELQQLRESPYERSRLVWRIMRLLRAHPELSGAVSNYLDGPGDPDLRLFQIASELTLLFDEYLMYRPDWIQAWEDDQYEAQGHEQWQRGLWRLVQQDLQASSHLHRAELHRRALEKLNGDADIPWQKLSVFGLSTMPPLQLETFRALSRICEVDIYFLNPCEHYWGDIVSERDMARRSVRALIRPEEGKSGGTMSDEDYLEVGNPLLSSLGKQGRELFEMLVEAPEIQSSELFAPSESGSALGFVKNDILDLTYGGEFGFGELPQKQSIFDNSLQVHICHSRMREVEVLMDELLRQMAADTSLKLSDVLVMVPDISDYAPFIHSVFSQEMSYRLADTSSVEQSTIMTTFLSLMRLPESRFSGSEVMDLLEVPAIMRKLTLHQDDLETISYWINGAGIRWEVDAESKSQFWSVPEEQQNTWRFGLDRLLLGFAMEEQLDTWQSTLPFDIEPSHISLLGKLCDFVELLDAYRDKLDSRMAATDWLSLITQMLSDFFEPAGNETLDISQLLEVTEELASRADDSGYQDSLSRQIVSHAIEKTLSSNDQRAGFISGGITFATLVPMRSIPFRVVCLLGMNSSEYPRDVRPHSFDLIAGSPHRKGDRSKKLDDRYLFLEALLSANDLFYVSYVGRGMRDDKPRPPSVVVQEWIDYLTGVFEQPLIVQHALQPYNSKYFRGDRLQSFNREWYEALTSNQSDTRRFTADGLPEDAAQQLTSTTQLGAFYRHPAKYFLQNRLGIYLESHEVELQDTESFELDSLERYQLADDALQFLLGGGDVDRFKDRIARSGQVLPGEVGTRHLEREIQRASNIRAAVEPLIDEPAARLREQFYIGAEELLLAPPNLHGDKLVSYRAGRLAKRHLIDAWIQHLAMNVVRPGTETWFVFRNKQDDGAATAKIAALDSNIAESLLQPLVLGYKSFMRSPIFLPPETMFSYVDAFNKKGGDTEQAMLSARQTWDSDQPGAEGADRYWLRVSQVPEDFDRRFEENALAIWQPILAHYEEVSHDR